MRSLEQADQYWALRALDFVSAAEAAQSSDEVLRLFGNEIAQVGFHAYLMIVMDSRDFTRRVIAHGWHREWLAAYTKENMAADDPVAAHFMRSLSPFMWDEAPYDRQAQPKARIVMERALDFRMNVGFGVPIHDDHAVTAISIAGER